MRIKIKSPFLKTLESFSKLMELKLRLIGIKSFGYVVLPVKRKKYTVLKSVHVNKKAREQFEVLYHSRLIVSRALSNKEILFLVKDKPSNISVKISI